MTPPLPRTPSFYNGVWRWHFYAGLFCIPFVIWLAVTGGLYLWRPQIEAWLDRPHDRLAIVGRASTAEAQVRAARAAVPGATLAGYVLPDAPGHATRILVRRAGEEVRVLIDPQTLAVLDVATEEKRPMRVLVRLHGELLAGPVGSMVVEVAACWAAVMLLTGLYLWWPWGRGRLAGVLYPRLGGGPRLFWRDIHATAGIWISGCALVLILTGLPWASVWGTYLQDVRRLTGTAAGPVDWTVGGKAPAATGGGVHAGHGGMAMPATPPRDGDLDRVVATVRPLGLAAPVRISPPPSPGAPWAAASNAADRPLRSEAKVDGATGRLLSRTDFRQRHWIDRMVGYGIAVHEGALFGLLNQIVGTLTCLALILLAVSGAIMWWRRRPVGLLGAPIPLARPRFALGLVGLVVVLGVVMPLFGLTLAAVAAAERTILMRLPTARRWLGLRRA